MGNRRGSRARRFCATAAAVIAAGSAASVEAAASTGLDGWEPAQVVDEQERVEPPTALFTTALGRAVIVYGVGTATWVSSRPAGASGSWEPPDELVDAPGDVAAGPVAAGSGGGAVVFLRSASGKVAYASMNPEGGWTEARTFPYEATFAPRVALVQPHSGVVAVGSGRFGGMVRAAVKPQGRRWQLSAGLPLRGHKLVRGAWYDDEGRVHVLVAAAQDDVDRREMYAVTLKLGSQSPQWGKVRLVPRGTEGIAVGDFHTVSLASNTDGAITVSWLDKGVQGRSDYYVRHRDPGEGWSPARRLPWPMTRNVETSLADDGTTRLSYVSWKPDAPGSSEGSYELITRLLSADGTLGEEQVLDTFAEERSSQRLEAARGAPGDMLLRWTRSSDVLTQPLFRCLSGSDCVAAGSMQAVQSSLLALAPDGTGFVGGLGDDVPGCPSGALCSRRLPTNEGTP